MKVEFFLAAEQELIEASAHYEAQLQGLGNDFHLEVERVSSVLVELPSLGEKLDTRWAQLDVTSVRELHTHSPRHSHQGLMKRPVIFVKSGVPNSWVLRDVCTAASPERSSKSDSAA